MESEKGKTIKSWYINTRPLYKKLTSKVESIISELLEERNLNVHAIVARTKDIESFFNKVTKKDYRNPKLEIHDLSGIRIITYVESDLEKASKVIRETFKIDTKNSVNKRDELGVDKVGYQSVHYIAELKADRLKLPEYKKFKGLKFEIQIRTILQHAWAEIEHDRNYKFAGQLPHEIKRRFTVLAGSLELADREFNSIAAAIDNISEKVKSGTKTGELDIEINSTTLNSFLENKFKNINSEIEVDSFLTVKEENEIISFLQKFEINTLKELNSILSDEFMEMFVKHIDYDTNYVEIISNALISQFGEKFFKLKEKGFYDFIMNKEISLHKELSIPIEKLIKKYEIGIEIE